MQKIKVKFVDFWANPSMFHRFILNILQPYYEVEISDEPDFLFFSCYGNEHHKYRCPKIFYTGENIRPDYRYCDFSFSFDYDEFNGRNYRLPLFLLYYDPEVLLHKPNPELIVESKKKFCNMIISNPNAKERIDFFNKLSKYRKVDSGGRYLNNIGGSVSNKIGFIKDYKFTIAFENSSYAGYTSEKIVQPMTVNSIPIYWGNPDIGRDFNENSFINAHAAAIKNMNDLVDYVVEIDRNENLYQKMQQEPYFNSNVVPDVFKKKTILNQLEFFFKESKSISKAKLFFRPYIYDFVKAKSSIGLYLYKKIKPILRNE